MKHRALNCSVLLLYILYLFSETAINTYTAARKRLNIPFEPFEATLIMSRTRTTIPNFVAVV